MEEFKRVVCPGTVPNVGYQRPKRVPVFCTVELSDDGRLSISGVIGPRSNGNSFGGVGQIDMEFAHRDPADDDRRYSAPITVDAFEWDAGWSADLWLDFLDVWKRWHLNDMRAECEHQRALGWTYDTHRDPESTRFEGLPCPTCGYRIGSEWRREDVPAATVAFLQALPATDRTPAWS